MANVLTERHGPIAVLKLNNPDQYNALTPELLDACNRALDAILAAPVRCVILTGAGKGFCAGAQLGGTMFTQGAAIGDLMRESFAPLITRLRRSPIPIVVAVNGPAAGAGVGIALAGDIVVAARSAKFVLSFVKLGAVLDGGTSLLVQRTIGTARARALAMTGDTLMAETAAEWGLIWKCVDDAMLADEAMRIARQVADGPPTALRMIKRQIEDGWNASLEHVLAEEAGMQEIAFETGDLREGASAFIEKRKPQFNGH